MWVSICMFEGIVEMNWWNACIHLITSGSRKIASSTENGICWTGRLKKKSGLGEQSERRWRGEEKREGEMNAVGSIGKAKKNYGL